MCSAQVVFNPAVVHFVSTQHLGKAERNGGFVVASQITQIPVVFHGFEQRVVVVECLVHGTSLEDVAVGVQKERQHLQGQTSGCMAHMV